MSSTSSTPRIPTLLEQFRALALSEGLKKKSKAYKERRKEFLSEQVQAGFIQSFGANASSLDNWTKLLATIGIEGASEFTSIKQCKASLKGKYINLVDLVDAANANKVISKPNPFPNPKKLARYIVRTQKIYPLERAKHNPLLCQFLISVSANLGRKKKGKKKNAQNKPATATT
ncbi:hypothetical protein Moror_10830 [Moniliophthora roreri MCA 2997]|uniref:Uncharacterized protein n=1 Tax=Moniliophthora roreri (strain MCA 2997) TaxID=1381753 RepID=V2X6C2_MONRO|nr:hypothetical protein Moror_10830 [Moniliophthora roreri MCA 2997]